MQQYGFFKNNGEHSVSFSDRKEPFIKATERNTISTSNCINHFARKLLKCMYDVYVSIHFVIKSAIILQLLKETLLKVAWGSGSADNIKESPCLSWCSNYTPTQSNLNYLCFIGKHGKAEHMKVVWRDFIYLPHDVTQELSHQHNVLLPKNISFMKRYDYYSRKELHVGEPLFIHMLKSVSFPHRSSANKLHKIESGAYN